MAGVRGRAPDVRNGGKLPQLLRHHWPRRQCLGPELLLPPVLFSLIGFIKACGLIDLIYSGIVFHIFKPEEITAIMNDFAEPGSLAPTGLYLGGTKYMVIQGEPGAVIRGKKGPGGVTIKKTNQALIIGIYDEPMTPGQCNMIVERLGDYLIDQGL
ncbi:hypothetical protein HYC85_026312 [Camellia sinensis]|uniref:Profilin n=1 Tax=Camellia sinensis TaxID=4442 RepID=A0A7J7G376_CAMSI|nr:hypothetical protein HYC85_026312 [Camellia sinensis]